MTARRYVELSVALFVSTFHRHRRPERASHVRTPPPPTNKEGFRVLEADAGKNALAVAKDTSRIDVLLTT